MCMTCFVSDTAPPQLGQQDLHRNGRHKPAASDLSIGLILIANRDSVRRQMFDEAGAGGD